MNPLARRRNAWAVLGVVGLVTALWLDGRAAAPGAAAPIAADTASRASPTSPTSPASGDPVALGAYLALAGNCAGCHTARGGAPYAGGRAIATPFGMVHASNLTPDDATGLGRWTVADFRRAMHEGRSRDGRALYPAFPYPDMTRITDADADALFAWLRTLAPVRAPNRAHALHFPWNLPLLLDAWRLVYFRPGRFVPDPARDAAWNRGAYLVTGLGHCSACHTARDALGGPDGPALGGGDLGPMGWHAPSLLDAREGAMTDWSVDAGAAWLASGLDDRAVAVGPMARVVTDSLQHLSDTDLRAMATYLRALPPTPAPRASRAGGAIADTATLALGAQLYERHCAECHGRDGEGAPPHWPALAGNRTLSQVSPVNTIRVVLHGGFAPATRANPRPYGMPPFGPELADREAAALVSWLRRTWGGGASAVQARDVTALRPVPLE